MADMAVANYDIGTLPYRLNYGLNYDNFTAQFSTGDVSAQFYATGSAATTKSFAVPFAPEFPLLEGLEVPVVPGSVVLRTKPAANPYSSPDSLMGDNGLGVLREYCGDGGKYAWVNRGTIDYQSGRVKLTNWRSYVQGRAIRASAVTTVGENLSSAYAFRTAAAPIAPGSLSIQYAAAGGGTATVSANSVGVISAPGVLGAIDYDTGLVRLAFGTFVTAAGNEAEPWYSADLIRADGKIFKPAPVPASSIRYTAVAYSYLPLDADLIGIDPVRLPSDGRVPIFRTGTMAVIGNSQTTAAFVPTNGKVVDLGRTRLSRAVVRDSTGKALYSGYSVDLEAGILTISDASGMSSPVTVEHRVEDMAVVRDVQISGELAFTRRITHAYPIEGSYVSSALEFGDRYAHVSTVFDQASWDGVSWSDTPIGSAATGTYNTTLSPIEVTNVGATTERWALRFRSTTTFDVIGEHVGVIATGDINTDCAPINPATGQPYFTIRALGWGAGWAAGNILRLNTKGALCPAWIVRTTQPGVEAGTDYSFDLLTRGDVDRP